MIRVLTYVALLIAMTSNSYLRANDEPVNWGVCSDLIKEHCSEAVDDKSKHDCLGKIDRAKFSKQCSDEYRKNCKRFGKSCKRHPHLHKPRKKVS